MPSESDKAVDEKALIEGLLARDKKAYEQAVRLYHSGLLRAARALVGEAIADEVVQETWVAVLTGLSAFEGRSSLKTWMYSVLNNIGRTRLRRESRNVSLGNAWDEPDPSLPPSRFLADGHWAVPPTPWHEDTPDAVLSGEELRRCLEKILSLLPAAQHSILTMRDGEGLEMDEICNILTISSTNGRVLLHRARNALRAAVERHARGEEC